MRSCRANTLIIAAGIIGLWWTTSAVQAEQHAEQRALRPMHIHKVKALGVEIWTEYEPEWSVEIVRQGKKPLFIAQTPPNVYPPAAMSVVSFPGMRVEPREMEAVARSAMAQAAANYKVPADKQKQLSLKPATYGDLTGYESQFSGIAHGEAVDVKVFVGGAQGKGPVSLQIYTLPGKLPHLREQIRRSWTHIRYLN